MPSYIPPIEDILFTLNSIIGLEQMASLPGHADVTQETVQSILTEAGHVATDILAPLNRAGDLDGARLKDGIVATTPGWQRAYDALADGGWIGLDADMEWGGMGLPHVLGIAVGELWHAANMALGLCPLLTQGAIHAISRCGSPEQKQLYLPKLIAGKWTGTMNLTEPDAGSDLGAIRTRALRAGDAWRIHGQKIFITYGDHDLAENIVHLVLARTPDAPSGIKGISLFLVPKFQINQDGTIGQPNDVHCLRLEHKLGIHGAPNCLMSFGDYDGALAELVGEENHGLEYMFEMMNHARLNIGLQGVAIAERAYQQARAYARERIQGRPVGFATSAPIIEHPDLRRHLMSMKAEIEAARALAYWQASLLDLAARHDDDQQRAQAKALAEFLTPVVKGWCTERSVDITSRALQVHGGMGYIEETGAAQHFRDSRIITIYEGTTAIQGNDLLNRKILREGGALALSLLTEIEDFAATLPAQYNLGQGLHTAVAAARQVIAWLPDAAARDPRLAAAASSPAVDLFGLILGGYLLAKGALAAHERFETAPNFLSAKIALAQFFVHNHLPQAQALATRIIQGAETVMSIPAEHL